MPQSISKIRPGALLLSEPFLSDFSFKRSVVLLTDYSSDGSLGFILNKPTHVHMGDAIDGFPLQNATLYFGGPVETDSLFFIHTCAELTDAKEFADGMYFGGDFDELKLRIENGEINITNIRFFAGYAGWDAGQLDQEINENAWVVSEPHPELTFENETPAMWEDVLKGMGDEYAELAFYPEDPNMN